MGIQACWHEGLVEVLRAVRGAGALSVCVVTDLVEGAERLVEGIEAGLVDVVSVMMYGHTAETYGRVAGLGGGGAEMHGEMMKNMGRLAGVVSSRGGMPLGSAAAVEGAGCHQAGRFLISGWSGAGGR